MRIDITQARQHGAVAVLFAICVLTTANPAMGQALASPAADGVAVEQQVLALNGELAATETESDTLRFSAGLEADGDLSGAANVLERYLFADHNAVMARAEYALLLCRLDDLEAGRFEEAKLASIPAPPDIMARIAKACADAVP
ncbi:MAG: hypothetical protein P8J20_09810, partial [Novosphingobium sp.]|nr:hypothetical protein [Novosphingobium sp.]